MHDKLRGTLTPTHGLASTSRMRPAISPTLRAVAAMDSCFALTGAHQHGIAVESMNVRTRVSKTLYC